MELPENLARFGLVIADWQASMVIRHNIVRGNLDVPKGKTADEIGLTVRLAAALQALPREGAFVSRRRTARTSSSDTLPVGTSTDAARAAVRSAQS